MLQTICFGTSNAQIAVFVNWTVTELT